MRKQRMFTVINGKASQKKKTGRFKKFFLAAVLVVVAVTAARSLLAYARTMLSARLVQTVVAEEGILDITVTAEGLVVRQEHLAAAPATGTLEWLLGEGERVALDTPVAVIDTGTARVPFLSPAPGILVRGLDGLEGVLSGQDLSRTDVAVFRALSLATRALADGAKVSQGTLVFKVVDNFQWFLVFDLPQEEAVLLEGRDSHTLCFAGGRELVGKVALRRAGEGRVTLAYRLDEDLGEALQNRFVTASVIVARPRGVLLPVSALVERAGESGVYTVTKSVVQFRRVDVLGESGDRVAVSGLAAGHKVVVNPTLVREGQRL